VPKTLNHKKYSGVRQKHKTVNSKAAEKWERDLENTTPVVGASLDELEKRLAALSK